VEQADAIQHKAQPHQQTLHSHYMHLILEREYTHSLVISNPIGQGFPEGVSEIRATHTIVDDD